MTAPAKSAAACILIALAVLLLAGCSGGGGNGNADRNGNDSGQNGRAPSGLSPPAQDGERAFNARCALCHGAGAAGTGIGPPLVHPVYEPGHHQDFAFRNAVRNGVTAHHWQFGNMPPLPGVSDAEIDNIICYVRELQRAQGIFKGAAC